MNLNQEEDQIGSLLEEQPLPSSADELSLPYAKVSVVTGPGHLGEGMALPRCEAVRVHTDVFGSRPPEEREIDERTNAVERELSKLPEEEKRAALRALRQNPLLFISSPHIQLILTDDGFDVQLATRRVADYWRKREAFFGEKAFSAGVFAPPSYNHYLRFYSKSMIDMIDPEKDEVSRELAMKYILSVNQTKIDAMDRIVDVTSQDDKEFLLDAQRQSPDLAQSKEHKLLFLWSEDFIEFNAAQRMMRYWRARYDSFGTEIAHRKIALSDLEDDIFHLKLGVMQLMPGTDLYGRPILVYSPSPLWEENWTEQRLKRVVWYVVHAAMEETSCQRNGAVVLMNYKSVTRELSKSIASFRDICRDITFLFAPIKVRSTHVNFGPANWWQTALVKGAYSVVSKMALSRSVIHVGTDEDFITEMESFGISANQVPVEMGGNFGTNTWAQWVDERRENGM